MKSVTATVTVVILAFAVAQYQTNSAQILFENICKILGSYSILKSRPENASGLFPQGCRWRDASIKSTTPPLGFWDIRYYEYWNESTGTWSSEQPSACRIQPIPFQTFLSDHLDDGNKQKNFTSRWRCVGDDYCIFENLWYNQGKFYYLTDDIDGMVR